MRKRLRHLGKYTTDGMETSFDVGLSAWYTGTTLGRAGRRAENLKLLSGFGSEESCSFSLQLQLVFGYSFCSFDLRFSHVFFFLPKKSLSQALGPTPCLTPVWTPRWLPWRPPPQALRWIVWCFGEFFGSFFCLVGWVYGVLVFFCFDFSVLFPMQFWHLSDFAVLVMYVFFLVVVVLVFAVVLFADFFRTSLRRILVTPLQKTFFLCRIFLSFAFLPSSIYNLFSSSSPYHIKSFSPKKEKHWPFF